MYRICSKLMNEKHLYGYRVIDIESGRSIKVIASEAIKLAKHGCIENVTVRNNRLVGNNIDLRKLRREEVEKADDDLKVDIRTLINGGTLKVITGKGLDDKCKGISKYKSRYKLNNLMNYLYNEDYTRVCGLIGLRRTGKTTMIAQSIMKLIENGVSKDSIALIEIGNKKITMGNLIDIIEKEVLPRGVKYLFIDEVTLCVGFVSGSAYLADSIATMGIKIVITGTDSLALNIASYDRLYDRIYKINTTFISYKEYVELFGHISIMDYIKIGGTLKHDCFSDMMHAGQYINTAIVNNIGNSLLNSKEYENYDELGEILKDGDKFSVIVNRIFYNTLSEISNSTINRGINFKRESLRLRTPYKLFDVENDVNKEISIVGSPKLKKRTAEKILDYLYTIGILTNIKNIVDTDREDFLVTMPGLRYMISNEFYSSINKRYKNELSDDNSIDVVELEREVLGLVLEGLVITETKNSLKREDGRKVYYFRHLENQEIDLVIMDKSNNTKKYELYEIKLSNKVKPSHEKHLRNEDILKMFGLDRIISRNIIYTGKTLTHNGINYLNVEEYLMNL